MLFVAVGLQAQQPPMQKVEGILNIVWGDPHPKLGSGGETVFSLESLAGTDLPLQLKGKNRVRLRLKGKENAALRYFGKRVVVTGRVAPSESGKPETMDVELIAPNQSQPVPPAPASVIGTKKVIYLLLKFSDDTAVPHPAVFYTDLNNPDTPPGGEVFPTTVNGFFKKTSYNQFSWIGDVGGAGGVGASGGWLTLPHPKSHYANCGWEASCVDTNSIGDDGTVLGRAQGIDFTTYDNINFVLSNDLDCCAWGGTYFSSVDSKVYGATWEPPWGQEAQTYSHEMGHSLGLPHSGWVYYDYDSPWDVMSLIVSANSVLCGTYSSINTGSDSDIYCKEPGDGYITPHKDFLGWIPTMNITEVTAGSSATATLEANSLALSSAIKMIRICITGFSCNGASARYFTVEARVNGLGASSQYDNGITSEGVIIHDYQADRPAVTGPCIFGSQPIWAQPADSTPNDYDLVNCNEGGRTYPDYALYNAQWSPGQTYTNSTRGFAVTVVSKSGSTYDISIQPVATKKPKGQVISD
jgi:M6 family metalloprotease-like protein